MATGPLPPQWQPTQRQARYPKRVAANVADAKVGLVHQLEQGAQRRVRR